MYYVMLCIYLLFISLEFYIFFLKKHKLWYWLKIATPRSGHQTNDNVPIPLTTDGMYLHFTATVNTVCFLITQIVELWGPQLINSEIKPVRFHGAEPHTSFTTALQILTGGIITFINKICFPYREGLFFLFFFFWAFLWFFVVTKHCHCSWKLNPTACR